MITVIACFALIASAVVSNKILLTTFSFPSFLFVGLRMALSGALLLVYCIARKSPRLTQSQLKRDIAPIALFAMATTFIPSVLKAFALSKISASKTTLLGSISPFVTAIYLYFLRHEKISRKQVLGIFFGIASVVVMLSTSSKAEGLMGEFLQVSWPEMAAIGTVLISQYGWIRVQDELKRDFFAPDEMNGLLQFIGGVFSLIAAYCLGEFALFAESYSWQFYFTFAYTIVIGNAIAYTIYTVLMKKYSATFIALSGLLVPFFVNMFGIMFGQEQLSVAFFIALALNFAGLRLFYSSKRSEKQAQVVEKTQQAAQ